jgi:integrase
MRRGELCNLHWSDVDLKRRVAHCRITKNGDARDVALSKRAIEIFQSLPREEGDAEELILGFKATGLTRAFVRLRDRLGMKDLKLHDLRHEATSRLAEKLNGDVIALSSMTGHKTLSMLKRYTHLRAEDVARKLD